MKGRMWNLWPGCAILVALPLVAWPVEAQQLQRQGEVAFVTGGVGFGEREVIEALEAREGLNVRLVFAEATGAYVARVAVQIRDAPGNLVLETTTDGPWLCARLPAGEYRVRATYRDTTRETALSAPTTGHREVTVPFPPGGPTS